MSLLDFLKQKGIEFQGAVKDVSTLAGVTPVQWSHERRPGLVWRIPEPESIPAAERVTVSSIFNRKQPVMVREYERAVVLENGKLYAELQAGIYDLSKVPLKGTLEIIWVTLAQRQFPWGVGGVMTMDGITVGGYGTVIVQVAEATRFVLALVASQQVPYTPEKIDDWLKFPIIGAMRQQLAIRDVNTLLTEREGLAAGLQEKLTPMLNDWGLQFKHIEMAELNLPPEYKHLRQAVGLGGFQRQAALMQAQTDADVTQIQAQARANAMLVEGTAQVQLQALMLANGVDPLKMETVKALMTYAQTPSAGSAGLISGDLNKPQVFAMLAGTLLDPGIPPQVKQTLRGAYPAESAAIPQGVAPMTARIASGEVERPAGSPAPKAPSTIEEIEAMIDGLDQQLAMGKIEQATYDRLARKWEDRLAKLKAGA
jgi:regulator of protease activity HflC (stomatin/prohibitin superfamily)